jgi:DNA-binding transcriptional ArsR family regulator
MNDERRDLLCIDASRAEAIRARMLGVEVAAAERARMFSDPTRLLLAALGEGGELCVSDLAWISSRAQNLVSHHLRLLSSHRLVNSRREGELVMYSLTDEGRSLLQVVLDSGAKVMP